MTIRLKLDPTNTEGGGGDKPPQSQQPPAPAVVSVAADQYQALLTAQTRLAQIEAERQQQNAQAEAERQKALIEKGQVEEALKLYKADVEPKLEKLSKTAEQYRTRLHTTAKNEAVARAFAGVQFVSDDAKNQALSIASGNLEVHEDDQGNLIVRQPGTGIPADQFLKSQIEGPSFAHFIKASNQGGSGATNPQPPAQTQQPSGLGVLQEQLFAAKASQVQQPAGIPGFGPWVARG